MRIAQRIDQHDSSFRAFMGMGPILIGAYPFTGLINPIWGSFFGFPLYAAAHGHPVYEPHPWTEMAAFFIWPLCCLAAMTWASGVVIRAPQPWRTAVIIIWCLSAFVVVPVQQAPILFPGWPIYCACE